MPLHCLSFSSQFRRRLPHSVRGLCLVLALSLGAGAAFAQTVLSAQTDGQEVPMERSPVPDQLQRDAQRARIAAARSGIAERLRAEEAACYQRFAVEDCLRAARGQARVEDNRLRQQEQELNAIERRERSAARLRAIEQRTEEKSQAPDSRARVDGNVRTTPSAAPSPVRNDAPTPRDLVQTQAERAEAARQRSQAQNDRQQAKAQELARKQTGEAERSAAARKRYEEKQREAQSRRERQRANAAKNAATRAAPLPSPPVAP